MGEKQTYGKTGSKHSYTKTLIIGLFVALLFSVLILGEVNAQINTGSSTTFSASVLRGDLNNNGVSADAGDLTLMKRASIGEIIPDSRYDLNNNGQFADAGDLVLMKRASIGEIDLQNATPPTVSSTAPVNNAVNILPKKTITVAFSEPLRQGVNYSLISFKDAGNNPVSTTNSITGNVLTIDPVSDLEYNKTYIITIPSGAVNDFSNNTLTNKYTFSFVTSEQPVLASITVSPFTVSVPVNSTRKFTAFPKDQFGNTFPTNVTWSSNNTTVGTIDSAGIFSALTTGTSIIIASSENVTGNATVTITQMLPTIQYQGPVGVFLDSVEAQNVRNSGSDFFAPYIFEILSHGGIPYARVSRDEIAASAENYPVLVLSHPTSFSVNETESIRRYVNDGGTLVALGSTSGLDNILGVAPAAHYDEGFINVTVTDSSLLRAPLALHVFSATPVTPVSAVSLARFLDRNYTDTGFAAVTSKSLGAGKAWYISADLALTVVKIQQGIPVVKDGVSAPDGSAPINDGILKAEDGIVLNWTRDRTKLTEGSLFLEPVADHLKEMFLGVILGAYSREDARLPLLWYWPGDLNAVGALSHDTDGNDESLAHVLLGKLTVLGIESTWCFIEHPDQYSLQLFRDIASARGETALHYDAQTGGNDTMWSEANFKSQLAWVENKTGLSVTTNKNHYTRWEGWVDFYRWLEAAGLDADQSKGPSKSGDSGFLFGTSQPYFPIDDAAHNNRFINVIAINLLTQDLVAKYPYSFGPQLIDKAVQHFGVGHFLFHPALINHTGVADAMANLVKYGRSKGMEWWTIDHINKWEKERRNIVFTNVDNTGFSVESPLNVNGITMLIPMQNDTEPIEIVINGSAVTWRLWHLYGVPTARFTVNISAGLTHVDLHTPKNLGHGIKT